MTTKTILYVALGIISFGASLLVIKNKKKSEELKKKMSQRVNEVKDIKSFMNSPEIKHPISKSIIKLLEDFDVHQQIGKKLNKEEILQIEEKLQLNLPNSYKIFLKYFGDGGEWVFFQNIDSIQNYYWLNTIVQGLEKTIPLEEKVINTDSLLCLMTEDSNGGAWVWLTSEKKENNEWSLAYYSMQETKLYYRVENFTEWLTILIATQNEVIRFLDVEEKLGLG